MSGKQRSAIQCRSTPCTTNVIIIHGIQWRLILTWNASYICWSVMLVTNISSITVTWHRYFSLSWCDIISTVVMWHTFHYRDVTYFSLPWCDILFTTVMLHINYRDVTYFSLPWCDILSTTVMWHTCTFNYRDVTHSPLSWCDILSTSVIWHTFHYRDATYFQLPGCDILSTNVMWHTFNYRDVTYFPLPWCDILQEISFFFLWNWLQLSHNSLNDWHDITEIDVIYLIDIITQWNENFWQTKVRLRRVMTHAKF